MQLVKAANVEIESYWPGLFASLAAKRNIEDIIVNMGSVGGGACAAAAVSAPAAGAGAAANAPPAQEKKKVMNYSNTIQGFFFFQIAFLLFSRHDIDILYIHRNILHDIF